MKPRMMHPRPRPIALLLLLLLLPAAPLLLAPPGRGGAEALAAPPQRRHLPRGGFGAAAACRGGWPAARGSTWQLRRSWFSSSTPGVSPFPAPAVRMAAGDSDGEAEGAAGGGGSGGETSSSSDETAEAIETDILSSPVFLRRKLEVVQKELEVTNAELEEARGRLESAKEEWQPQLDELEKEYARIQSRMSDQSAGSDAAATVQVVRQVLGVLDTFERAFGSVRASTDEEREVERQYREVADLILETFEKLGVEAVETVGKEFDYEVHQAVLQRPSDRYEEGIVCEELQKGFKLGDQLVRAAMVAVAA